MDIENLVLAAGSKFDGFARNHRTAAVIAHFLRRRQAQGVKSSIGFGVTSLSGH